MNKKTKLTDAYLVDQYKSGNSKVLSILVKRWHIAFCDKAYWVTKDKAIAKDIAQDSWITIINKIHTLKNTNSFKSWAFRIVYTKAIDWVKQNNITQLNKKVVIIEKIEGELVNDKREIIKKELLKAIKKLPKEKQDAIRLFYVQSYSLKEISSILNIAEGTVKSRLFKAREKLKIILKSSNYEK